MSPVFALLAAFSNALDTTAQHIASTSGGTATSSGLRLLAELIRSPLWLFGSAAGLAGFVFQAAALRNGQLSIVQALLVTELVFGLVLRKVWLRQGLRTLAWASAALTCVALAAFVAIDEPQGGISSPTARAWVSGLAVFGGSAAIMVLAARWGPPKRRAALYATAAAIVWAVEATFIKTTTETLTDSGIAATLTHWPVYALAAGGIAGIALVQAALHVGPLSVSQPLLVIVNPAVSIVLSIWLFQEHYTGGAATNASSVVSFAAMCVGVVALTRTAPGTMQAAVSGSAP